MSATRTRRFRYDSHCHSAIAYDLNGNILGDGSAVAHPFLSLRCDLERALPFRVPGGRVGVEAPFLKLLKVELSSPVAGSH